MRRYVSWLAVAAVFAVGPMGGVAYGQDGESPVSQPGGIRDASPQERPQMLSFFLIVPYHYGFGIGAAARYTLPIVKDGFIPKLNDSVELEFGADFAYLGGVLGVSLIDIGIPVEARWTFHITPEFSAYGKIGLGLDVLIWTGAAFSTTPVGFYWNTAAGVLYQLSDTFYLRGELGYRGLRAGVGFTF